MHQCCEKLRSGAHQVGIRRGQEAGDVEPLRGVREIRGSRAERDEAMPVDMDIPGCWCVGHDRTEPSMSVNCFRERLPRRIRPVSGTTTVGSDMTLYLVAVSGSASMSTWRISKPGNAWPSSCFLRTLQEAHQGAPKIRTCMLFLP